MGLEKIFLKREWKKEALCYNRLTQLRMKERLKGIFRRQSKEGQIPQPSQRLNVKFTPLIPLVEFIQLQLFTPDIARATEDWDLEKDAPFFIGEFIASEKEISVVCRVGDELMGKDNRLPTGDDQGMPVFRSLLEDPCGMRVNRGSMCDALMAPLFKGGEIFPPDLLSHWYARVKSLGSENPVHPYALFVSNVEVQSIVAACYEDHKVITEGVVVDIGGLPPVSYMRNLLVPICSVEAHPEYESLSAYNFEVTDKGEVLFRKLTTPYPIPS